jgi:RNA polymerase sigma-70 factor (ECF subfamily)
MRSPQMAEQLANQLGRPITADGVRQMLHRARERFAVLLLEEVTHTVAQPTAECVTEELAELGLLDYCRPTLPHRDR